MTIDSDSVRLARNLDSYLNRDRMLRGAAEPTESINVRASPRVRSQGSHCSHPRPRQLLAALPARELSCCPRCKLLDASVFLLRAAASLLACTHTLLLLAAYARRTDEPYCWLLGRQTFVWQSLFSRPTPLTPPLRCACPCAVSHAGASLVGIPMEERHVPAPSWRHLSRQRRWHARSAVSRPMHADIWPLWPIQLRAADGQQQSRRGLADRRA